MGEGAVGWGLITVVRHDRTGEVTRCCSQEEGEYATREDAQAASDHQKRCLTDQLDKALALLEGIEYEIHELSRQSLDDLIRYREHTRGVDRYCDSPMCFAAGEPAWWAIWP